MNIEEVDKWLKDQYGISYTEMSNEFNSASELLSKKIKEIERQKEIIKQLDIKNLELTTIIKEVREYINIDKNCIPKHIKDYINNLLDKELSKE